MGLGLNSPEVFEEPLSLDKWGEVFGEAINDDELVESFQSMRGLKEGEKDGFFYTIASKNSRGKQVLCVKVTAFGPDNKPLVEMYGGPASSWEELVERSPEVAEDKSTSLLQIDADQVTAHKIFTGKIDPVQAAMSRKAKVKGDMAFVMRLSLIHI